MSYFFRILLCLFLAHSPTLSWSASTNQIKHQAFSEKLTPILNRFRSTHDAAKIILKFPDLPKKYHEVARFFVNRRNLLMPKITIQGEVLSFHFMGQKTEAKYLKGSDYLINGQKINFDTYDFSQTTSALWNLDLLFFDEAQAIAWMPIYFGMIVVAGVLGAGCVAEAIGSQRGPGGGAKWIRNTNPTSLDRALNNAFNELKQLCSAANASAGNEYYQFSSVLEGHCRNLAQSPNGQAARGGLQTHLEGSQYRQCRDQDCTSFTGRQVGFSYLPSSTQEALLEMESPDFNRQCFEWGQQLVNGAPALPANPNEQGQETTNSI